jgi:hypothetical protein
MWQAGTVDEIQPYFEADMAIYDGNPGRYELAKLPYIARQKGRLNKGSLYGRRIIRSHGSMIVSSTWTSSTPQTSRYCCAS